MFEALQALSRVIAFVILFFSLALIVLGAIATLISVFISLATEEDTCDEED